MAAEGKITEVIEGTDKPHRADDLYAMALALAPSVGDHMRIPGSLRLDDGLKEACALIERALVADAGNARVQAALGNILLRGGLVDLARDAYERAASLDPRDAASRYAVAELAYVMRDEATAQILVPRSVRAPAALLSAGRAGRFEARARARSGGAVAEQRATRLRRRRRALDAASLVSA